MYASHWGLEESPFQSCLDPQRFYQSPTHEEALARLYFLLEQRRRLGILLGPAGSGKSLLLEVFAQQLRRDGRPVAKLNLLGLQGTEIFALLAVRFGVNVAAAASPSRSWRALADRLAEYRYQQLAAAVLLDDADRASPQTLLQVARLAHHDPSPDSRLTLVLAARDDRLGRLGDRLLDLADLRIDLEPWEQSDTADFLEKSLSQAGCRPSIFAAPAVARLHELAHGIPRRVSQLADLALLAGAGRELPQIDAEVVDSVYRELAVVEV